MVKLYFDMLEVDAVHTPHRATSQDILKITGYNIGNFAFRHALRHIIDDLDTYVPVDYHSFKKRPDRYETSQLLISCANWLGLSEQDEEHNAYRARTFDDFNVPLTAFGLGTQAKLGAKLPKLGPHTVRLAKVLSERSTKLSVRDQLTAETLEAEGIHNVVVTGCPSNFIAEDPAIGQKVAADAARMAEATPGWRNVRSLISEMSQGHAMSGKIAADHLRLMHLTPAFYVVQDPTLLPFVLRESNDIPDFYLKNHALKDEEQLFRVLKSKTLHFSSITAWLDFARTCDLSFGMRIHGTMLPLQAGVPSILISHDARTSGLAEFMGIPSVSPERFLEISRSGPTPLFTAIAEKMSAYDDRRRALAGTMLDYVKANALTPHPALETLAQTAPTHH